MSTHTARTERRDGAEASRQRSGRGSPACARASPDGWHVVDVPFEQPAQCSLDVSLGSDGLTHNLHVFQEAGPRGYFDLWIWFDEISFCKVDGRLWPYVTSLLEASGGGMGYRLVTRGPLARVSSPWSLDLPLGRFAMVSRDVLEGGAFPTEAYRKEPDSIGSSGWVVVSEQGAGPGLVPMLVDDLIKAFRILDSVLDEPVGSRWLWNPDTLEYVRQPGSA